MHVVPLCTPVRKPQSGQAAQTSSFLPQQLVASLGDRIGLGLYWAAPGPFPVLFPKPNAVRGLQARRGRNATDV